MEFCYLIRRSQIDSDTMDKIDAAISCFHQERNIFIESGVRNTFKLPRQHALSHYHFLIQQFGAPNGLCSSITECRHITAVKQPWRRSNHNEPLGQMLLTNQCLDKLAMSRIDFDSRELLNGPLLSSGPLFAPSPEYSQVISNTGNIDPIEDAEPVEGITSEGDVKLAQSEGESRSNTDDLNA